MSAARRKKNHTNSKVSINDLVDSPAKTEEDATGVAEAVEGNTEGQTSGNSFSEGKDLPVVVSVKKDIKRKEKKKATPEEKVFFKRALIILFGFSLLLGITFISVFFLIVRGGEETKVPEVIGKELVDGLLVLQERELYPKVQLRYTSDPLDKGLIVDQDPIAGSDVRAGRRINIVVSNGAVVDRVENYVDQQLADVRLHLMTLFANYRPLLRIKEPVIYVFDEKPEGTILQQNPEPGTEISTLTDLELVVSRGEQGRTFPVMEYVGQNYLDALAALSLNNIPFVLEFTESENPQETGRIIAQIPEVGASAEVGTAIRLNAVYPDVPVGYVFDVLRYNLPENPGPVELSLVAEDEMGNQTEVFATLTTGGVVTLPYMERPGTKLTLTLDSILISTLTVTEE